MEKQKRKKAEGKVRAAAKQEGLSRPALIPCQNLPWPIKETSKQRKEERERELFDLYMLNE